MLIIINAALQSPSVQALGYTTPVAPCSRKGWVTCAIAGGAGASAQNLYFKAVGKRLLAWDPELGVVARLPATVASVQQFMLGEP